MKNKRNCQSRKRKLFEVEKEESRLSSPQTKIPKYSSSSLSPEIDFVDTPLSPNCPFSFVNDLVIQRTNEALELENRGKSSLAQVFYQAAFHHQTVKEVYNEQFLNNEDNSPFLRSKIEKIQKTLTLEELLCQLESFVDIFKSSFLKVANVSIEGDKRWDSIRSALGSFDRLTNIALKMKVYGDVYSLFTEMNSNKSNYFQNLFEMLENCVDREFSNFAQERNAELQTVKSTFQGKLFISKEKEEFLLPLDVCRTVCEYLDFQSLFQLRQVNRRWHHVISTSLLWHTPVIEARLLFRSGERMTKKLSELKACLRYAENFASHCHYSPSEIYLLLFLERFILSSKRTILSLGVGSNPICTRLCDFLKNFQNQILQKEFTVSNYCNKMKENPAFRDRTNLESPFAELYAFHPDPSCFLDDLEDHTEFSFMNSFEQPEGEAPNFEYGDLLIRF